MIKKIAIGLGAVIGLLLIVGLFLPSKIHVERSVTISAPQGAVFANELEIVDGRLTGRVVGEIVNGQTKARLLEEIARKEHIRLEQSVAVGDGANDLPMLSKAGLGIAFRAKPIVRETARQAISTLGLDAILYLMGFRDRESLPS